MTTQGDTESRVDFPTINFESMTYSLQINYGDPQTNSTLIDVSSNGASFTVEREDAVYRYNIKSVGIYSAVAISPEATEL